MAFPTGAGLTHHPGRDSLDLAGAAPLDKLSQCRIGTVDKFQGQEAPVSIYSMATSSAEEAPRGMEFLYSLNRLNVATSRAQCLAVLVANPDLIDVRCRTPRQIAARQRPGTIHGDGGAGSDA